MFKRLIRSYAKARTASALSNLSDHQLADIGITRQNIWAHVEKVYA